MTYSNTDTFDLDLSNFHQTEAASTALCSAKDIDNFRKMYYSSHPEENPDHKPRSNYVTRDVKPSLDHPKRSLSVAAVVPRAASTCKERVRRCSLGDMVRNSQGNNNPREKGNALNLYRHRPSITDTYLGCEVVLEDMEEDEEESEAILSVVSTRSQEKRTDVRDVFKKRRSSVTQLFFTDTDQSVSEVVDGGNRDLDLDRVWTSGAS